jgi:hypothetical protein
MKKLISLLTVMVLTLAFGTAYADFMPEYFPKAEIETGVTGAAPGGVRAEIGETDAIWDGLFNVDLQKDVLYPEIRAERSEAGVTGAAPGGVRTESSDWDSLFNVDLQKDAL